MLFDQAAPRRGRAIDAPRVRGYLRGMGILSRILRAIVIIVSVPFRVLAVVFRPGERPD